jgi:hypothetical protein
MGKQSPSKKSPTKTTGTEKKGKTGAKKQPSGYLTFCNEQRTHRKADFDTLKPKEVMQHLGAEWRKLSAQQQETYKSKAPTKPHHDVSNKLESTSEKRTATTHQSNTKRAGKTKHNTKHQLRSKGASKKKTKKARGKSAQHNEDSYQEANINPSE